MSKLNSTLHGIFDYMIVGGLFAAPAIYKLSKSHATVANAVGSMFAVTNLITKYPLAVKRVVPFPVHGMMEGLTGGLLLLMAFSPTKLGIKHRFFYLSSAAQLLVLVVSSDYSDESKTLEPLWEDPESKKSKQRRAADIAVAA